MMTQTEIFIHGGSQCVECPTSKQYVSLWKIRFSSGVSQLLCWKHKVMYIKSERVIKLRKGGN